MHDAEKAGPTRTLRARASDWARVALVNLTVLLGLAVAGELIFGTWVFGPNLGTLNVHTNVRLRIADSPFDPPGTAAYYTRDRYGLRGDYGGDPAKVTLLAVGGSTTAEVGVGDDDAWTSVLQRALRGAGPPVTVANAGSDGHSTLGHIKSFEVWFPRIPGLKPRYVLFFIGVNERGVAADANAGADTLAFSSSFRRIRSYVENNSAIVRGVRTVRGWLAARRIGVHHGSGKAETEDSKWVPARIPPDLARRMRSELEAYRGRLAALHAKTLAFGATPIYVTQINGDGRRADGEILEIEGSGGGRAFVELSLYNDVLRRFCSETGARCIDLAAELHFGPGDFYDTYHTTPQGSRKIGTYLAAKLRPILR
jgi:lysophospholipase L1-like esterase